MHILEFPDTNIVRYIPAELSECDASQYIFMCNLFFLYQCGEITKDEMLNNAVYHLMNMKPSKSTSIGNEDKTNIVLIEELIESSFFDKLFKSDDENDYQLKLKQNYINNPVPEYKPNPRFRLLSMEVYRLFQKLFDLYSETLKTLK